MENIILSASHDSVDSKFHKGKKPAAIYCLQFQFKKKETRILTREQLGLLMERMAVKNPGQMKDKPIQFSEGEFKSLLAMGIEEAKTKVTTINQVWVSIVPEDQYTIKVTNQLGQSSEVTILEGGMTRLKSHFNVDDAFLLNRTCFVTYESNPGKAFLEFLLHITDKNIIPCP